MSRPDEGDVYEHGPDWLLEVYWCFAAPPKRPTGHWYASVARYTTRGKVGGKFDSRALALEWARAQHASMQSANNQGESV